MSSGRLDRPEGTLMNFDEYEKKYQPLYASLAETVRFILEKAIASANVPQPQSIQCRAKSAKSLKARLESSGLLQSSSIEASAKT